MYVDNILKGQCQILNLLENSRRKYTVELVEEKEGYVICQIKGRFNNDEMEGIKGKGLRKELCKIVNNSE